MINKKIKLNLNYSFHEDLEMFRNELAELDDLDIVVQLALFNKLIEQTITSYCGVLLKDYSEKYILNKESRIYSIQALHAINNKFCYYKSEDLLSEHLSKLLKIEFKKNSVYNQNNKLVLDLFIDGIARETQILWKKKQIINGSKMDNILNSITATTCDMIYENLNTSNIDSLISPIKLFENPKLFYDLEAFIVSNQKSEIILYTNDNKC